MLKIVKPVEGARQVIERELIVKVAGPLVGGEPAFRLQGRHRQRRRHGQLRHETYIVEKLKIAT